MCILYSSSLSWPSHRSLESSILEERNVEDLVDMEVEESSLDQNMMRSSRGGYHFGRSGGKPSGNDLNGDRSIHQARSPERFGSRSPSPTYHRRGHRASPPLNRPPSWNPYPIEDSPRHNPSGFSHYGTDQRAVPFRYGNRVPSGQRVQPNLYENPMMSPSDSRRDSMNYGMPRESRRYNRQMPEPLGRRNREFGDSPMQESSRNSRRKDALLDKLERCEEELASYQAVVREIKTQRDDILAEIDSLRPRPSFIIYSDSIKEGVGQHIPHQKFLLFNTSIMNVYSVFVFAVLAISSVSGIFNPGGKKCGGSNGYGSGGVIIGSSRD
ncbi:hypothetical protein GCK72_010332 [Caenorhabditis remanei]|uniref:Uncharacterized protein n=1 Tax=Caenorhabditis remanei TaxID=31234 RepID=A0A6A5H2L3_CAERE|nr:hypothetical protein GCK72_010332 [Caenorhabditis remanei]KAF1762070.1 hypothetical protein GCK72_010332 [Caenorhabditis remanei]